MQIKTSDLVAHITEHKLVCKCCKTRDKPYNHSFSRVYITIIISSKVKESNLAIILD